MSTTFASGRPGSTLRPDLHHALTTTAFTLNGYEIVENLGIVRGIAVRSRSAVGNLFAGLQTIVGGRISVLADLCETARSEALQNMVDHALALGGNAVIGIRYDANNVMSGVTEVLCYGTAVIVEEQSDATHNA